MRLAIRCLGFGLIVVLAASCCNRFIDGYCFDDNRSGVAPLNPGFWIELPRDANGNVKKATPAQPAPRSYTRTDNSGCPNTCPGMGEVVSCRRTIACDDSDGYLVKDALNKTFEFDGEEDCCTPLDGVLLWVIFQKAFANLVAPAAFQPQMLGVLARNVGVGGCGYDHTPKKTFPKFYVVEITLIQDFFKVRCHIRDNGAGPFLTRAFLCVSLEGVDYHHEYPIDPNRWRGLKNAGTLFDYCLASSSGTVGLMR